MDPSTSAPVTDPQRTQDPRDGVLKKVITFAEPKVDHPSSRWETAYVYAFIVKFTNIRGKDGLDSPVDLEEALLFPGPTPVLEQVLSRFVLNLRPGSRNTGPNSIARTTQTIMEEFLRTNERSCWWDDALHQNADPFAYHDGDLFTLPWETKTQYGVHGLQSTEKAPKKKPHPLRLRVILKSNWLSNRWGKIVLEGDSGY
ncbi:hypothetical protein FRC06_009027 [Ceratobasidium sp. 370]|nr:hypothetical protein FRC06_009027 [Ceratobasidium sp. 370]